MGRGSHSVVPVMVIQTQLGLLGSLVKARRLSVLAQIPGDALPDGGDRAEPPEHINFCRGSQSPCLFASCCHVAKAVAVRSVLRAVSKLD